MRLLEYLRSGRSLRAIAAFEITKGLLVLAAGAGILEMAHRNVHRIALVVIEHLHLNPASHYARIFVDAFTGAVESHGVMLALGASAYSTARFIEGYGLWRRRMWGRIVGILSCVIYVPFELWDLYRGVNVAGVAAFAVNLVVLLVLWYSRVERVSAPD